MIESKDFSLSISDISNITSGLHTDAIRELNLTYASDPYIMQVFKGSLATAVSGIIIYFSGGDGVETLDASNPFVSYVSKNFIVINFKTRLNLTFGVPVWTNSIVQGAGKHQAREVDVALKVLYDKISTDPMFTGLFTNSTPVYLFGHSRGATTLAFWSELQNSNNKTSIYSSRVKGIGCNSPAGNHGSGMGGSLDAYMATRKTYDNVQKGSWKMLVTTGADDRTNLLRAEAEIINRELDPWAPVKFSVTGGVGDGHFPYYGRETEWFDEVIAFANTP